MKRLAQSLIVTLIIAAFINNSSAQQIEDNVFKGIWESNIGSIVKIDGNQGILLYAPSELWKKYINKPIIKIIGQHYDSWVVEELVLVDNSFHWLEISWRLKNNLIIKHLIYLKDEGKNYYKKISDELDYEIPVIEKKPFSHPYAAKFDITAGIGKLQRHTWEVGAILSKFTYEEPGLMKDEGFFYGIEGSYTFRNQKDLMIKAEGRYCYGKVDYESKSTGTIDGIRDYIFEIRGLIGNDFPISKISTITPYIGLSYRYLNDDSSGRLSSTGASGYERESNYYYIPIGMETVTELKSGLIFGTIIEFDYFWKGEQISHLSDVDPRFNNINNDQNNGYGFRGSLKFLWKDKHNEYIIEPFIRYWNINESEWAIITDNGSFYGYGYEPANESTEIGLNIRIRF